ncbi:MAG: thioredoxin-disulfide reductase [Patescibacteria group bacterium]
MLNKNIYDVVIIGGGPAGLTAAIYAGRRELKALVLTKDIGGQASTTDEIENWPGEISILGPELMKKFQKQAEKWGANIEFALVRQIKREKDIFTVATDEKEYHGRTVILAFGLSHRKLGVEGEKEYLGKGVSYCATCDGPLFKNKVVGVIGGGNSALDAAEYLAKITEKVYLFVRRDAFNEKTEQVLIDAIDDLEKQGKIEVRWNSEVKKITGDKFLEKVEVLNNKTNETKAVDLKGLFIEIGFMPQTEVVKGLVDLDEREQIIIDQGCQTSREGIFAAGDVTISPFKQLVTSAGEGAKAALSAYQYIQQLKGDTVGSIRDYRMKKM